MNSDLFLDVGCAGAAGVAGPEDLVAGGDVVAEGDGEVVAVAVGPAAGVAVDHGDTHTAGVAAAAAGCAAAIGPPVVRPGSDRDDGPVWTLKMGVFSGISQSQTG